MNKPDLSLEELADANKSEFDRLFATQMALGTPIAAGGAAQTLTSPHLTEKDADNARLRQELQQKEDQNQRQWATPHLVRDTRSLVESTALLRVTHAIGRGATY